MNSSLYIEKRLDRYRDPLEDRLIELYNEYLSRILGFDPMKNEPLNNNQKKIIDDFLKRPLDYLAKLVVTDEKFSDTFEQLVVKSIREEFFYYGSNYKTIVSCVLRDKAEKNNRFSGYEEVDYIKDAIIDLKDFLENYASQSMYQITPEFCISDPFGYMIFLSPMHFNNIRRNLKKAIKILKQEVKNLERSSDPITEEEVTYDYGIEGSDMSKLSYFNESGIIKHLHENNSPKIIAKFLMRFMDFKNKEATIERYVKICLQEPYNKQYPKNSEDVKTFLTKINFIQ